MKRNPVFYALIAGAILTTSLPLYAQDSAAAAAAEREEREASFRRMNALIEQLQETLQSQQRRMNTLVEEVHNLREQVDKLKNKAESTATTDAIKQLATKIEEVDTKRQKDNELVYKKIAALGKEVATTLVPKEPVVTPPPKSDPKPAQPKESDGPPENSMAYKIKDGDTLSRIVTDLRAINIKVTQKQIMDANPKVNWNKLRIGQTIYIPATQ